MEINRIYNVDCMEFINELPDESVDTTITDIPYDMVNRKTNGLRVLDKGKADILNFDLLNFLKQCYRVTKSTIIIFCSPIQISEIINFFFQYQKKKKGTVRQLIWSKTNPSPMNGKYIYLSSVENIVWFRKPKGVFNAYCKKGVFTYPSGKSKIHPTQKNIDLIKELILDNSNEGDLIFDPCCGSGTHCLAAKELNRNYLGCEIDKEWAEVAIKRLSQD